MYLPTIMQNGKTLLIEADSITRIQLIQPLGIENQNPMYVVLIDYENSTREQAVITEDTWNWWNNERRNNGDCSTK